MPLNHLVFRFSLPLVLLSLSGGAVAIGLGELRGQPALGDRLRLEIDLLGADKHNLDPACFRLIQPSSTGDLPWLKKASMSIRQAVTPVLEIRSEIPLREPILQLAVQMTCGVEVSREYMLLASPLKDVAPPSERIQRPVQRPVIEASRVAVPVVPHQVRPRPVQPERIAAPARLLPRAEKRSAASRLPDRILVADGIDVGEPSLRLAAELLSWRGGQPEAKEAQREILRLEFRMLAALHEQVTTQMATAEKLRNMEATLSELQQRTTEFAQRVEKNEVPVAPAAQKLYAPSLPSAVPAVVAPAAMPRTAPQATTANSSTGLSDWSLYGLALGAFLGLAGWLGWNKYRERQQQLVADEYLIESPDIEVDPKREGEREELGGVDLHVSPVAMGMPMQVDLELDGGEPDQAASEAVLAAVPVKLPASVHDSLMSISAATVDEHFESNPVMELADIMLSFGRVKGAAQALQEYIDNNPQEALQPWIRLMDVYRMAGMRAEFETVASNLNQNFNVEVQHWDGAPSLGDHQSVDLLLDEAAPAPVASRPESLEDMPRIMSMVCELWPMGDVVGYLYQLLRDNRGGKRVGFALPVVEEILFLVELKETSNRIE